MALNRRAQLRHRAREIALQLIYMTSMRPESSEEDVMALLSDEDALSLFEKELTTEGDERPVKEKFPFISAFDLELSDSEKDEVLNYASEMYHGVKDNENEIDAIIRANIESSWRPDRLVAIDRAVIALALYEGMLAGKVPVNVAISEAVESAKTFGTEESSRFVNGVLGRIARKDEKPAD